MCRFWWSFHKDRLLCEMNSDGKCGNLSMVAIPRIFEYNISWGLATCQCFLISGASWFQLWYSFGDYRFDILQQLGKNLWNLDLLFIFCQLIYLTHHWSRFRSILMLFDALQYLVENNCKKQHKAGHSTEMVWWLATWARKPEVSRFNSDC